jgi:hypothetical protein
MFDFIRNLTKSEAEKRQETLSAYLDNALTPREKAAFEEQLRSDSALRASLEEQRLLKQNISRLPRLRAPRNFTLDPAVYGRPAPQPAIRLYPIMRTATALAAVMLIFLFSLELFSPTVEETANAPEDAVALSQQELDEFNRGEGAEGAASAGESVAEEAAMEPAAEQPAVEEQMEAEEEMVEAEDMEEEMMEAETAEEPAAEESQAVPTTDRDLLGVAGGADSYPAPVAGGDAAANAGPSPTFETATEQEAPVPEEAAGDGGTVDIDGGLPTVALSPTTAVSSGLNEESGFAYDMTTTIPEEGSESEDTVPTEPPPSPLRFLQIGLGVLVVVLLAATLLLRRQI